MGMLKPRVITAIIASVGFAVASYLLWQSYAMVHLLPKLNSRAVSSVPDDFKMKSPSQEVVVSLEEVIVNVESRRRLAPRSLAMKVELELFDEGGKVYLEQRQPALRDVMIESALEQNYETLSTAEGKLYFKELLVSRMNEFLHRPVVREVQFSLFYLQ
jgi:flagellar basal body-associated protein FliL